MGGGGLREGGIDASRLAKDIEAALLALGTPEGAKSEKAYLKSDLEHFGVPVPELRRAIRDRAGRSIGLDRRILLATVRELWKHHIHECRAAAVELLGLYPEYLKPSDLTLLRRLVTTASTWALVDPLAIGVVGQLAEAHPGLVDELDRWAEDDDFWVRRSAMLALLRPLRRGEGDFDRFGRYADAMLEEKEFFIRKAIGWVLRETAKRRPDLVYDWLAPRAHRASGVTMREGVKPLPAPQAEELMKAYRERPR